MLVLLKTFNSCEIIVHDVELVSSGKRYYRFTTRLEGLVAVLPPSIAVKFEYGPVKDPRTADKIIILDKNKNIHIFLFYNILI